MENFILLVLVYLIYFVILFLARTILDMYIDAQVNKKIIKQMDEALEQDDSPHGKLWRYTKKNGPLFQDIEDTQKLEIEKKMLEEAVPEIKVIKKE